MQVGGCAIPGDLDIITSDLFCLIVQGLRNVAEEMYEELECLLRVLCRESPILDSLRIVGNGPDDTAPGPAIARQVDAAR